MAPLSTLFLIVQLKREQRSFSRCLCTTRNLAKASSVIQVDMYQSLMLMSQQLQLILVRDLYEEISDIEQRFKALQQGFNTNQLFPYINIGINLSLAMYYYQQTEYEQALEYLEDYCQCYERVVRNCNYQQDYF